MTSKHDELIDAFAVALGVMSVANGYHYDWNNSVAKPTAVDRLEVRREYDFSRVPRAVVHAEAGRADESQVGGISASTASEHEEFTSVTVIGYFNHDITADSRPSDSIMFEMLTDIVRAALADQRLGGLAQDVRFAGWARGIDDPPTDIVLQVEFIIQHVYPLGDPR